VAVQGPIGNWTNLGVSKNGPCELASFGCVEKRPTANWSDLGVSKTAPGAPPGPGPGHLPKGPPSTGQIAHHQLAKFECRKFTTPSQETEGKQVRESRKRRPAPPGPAPPPPVCGQGPSVNWPAGSVSRTPGRHQGPSRELAGPPTHRNPRGPPPPRPSPPSSTGECPRRRDPGPVRPGRPPPPSKRPALPGPLMGRY
jgi:hypothetical protein